MASAAGRHAGHAWKPCPSTTAICFNWYETRTLQVLPPAYVSTVDSGNLAGHAAGGGAVLPPAARSRRAPRTAAEARRLHALGRALRSAVHGHGLQRPVQRQAPPLSHRPARRMKHALDASYYDLIASESRLTSFLAIAKGDVGRGATGMALGRAFLTVGDHARAQILVGLDVRIPDALAADDGARRGLLHVRAWPRSSEQQAYGESAGPALGRLRIGLFRPGPHAGLPVLALRRAAPGPAPHAARPTAWSRPMPA